MPHSLEDSACVRLSQDRTIGRGLDECAEKPVLFFPLAALLVLWAASVGWSQPESTGEFILTAGYATVVLGGVAWLVTYDPGELRRCRRIEANGCPSCGYSREGLTSERCPACGEPRPECRT